MLIDINKYDCFIFDCDGVILDSNKIKTEAFFLLALPYGKGIAKALVDYHTQNGGISRYLKIKYLIEGLLRKKDLILEDKLVKEYGELVYHELLKAKYINGFINFIETHGENKTNFILSGGDQNELNKVFQNRNTSSYFSKILGSPVSKYENVETILPRIKANKTILFGDSKLDYEVANYYGFNFVFLYGKSEFTNWEKYFENKNVICIKNWLEVL